MACLICDYGLHGDGDTDGQGDAGSLRIQITEVDRLDPDLQLPDGGVDAEMCGECWRWIRGIAADPESLVGEESQRATLQHDAQSDD